MGLYVEQVTANRLKSHLCTHMRTDKKLSLNPFLCLSFD